VAIACLGLVAAVATSCGGGEVFEYHHHVDHGKTVPSVTSPQSIQFDYDHGAEFDLNYGGGLDGAGHGEPRSRLRGDRCNVHRRDPRSRAPVTAKTSASATGERPGRMPGWSSVETPLALTTTATTSTPTRPLGPTSSPTRSPSSAPHPLRPRDVTGTATVLVAYPMQTAIGGVVQSPTGNIACGIYYGSTPTTKVHCARSPASDSGHDGHGAVKSCSGSTCNLGNPGSRSRLWRTQANMSRPFLWCNRRSRGLLVASRG